MENRGDKLMCCFLLISLFIILLICIKYAEEPATNILRTKTFGGGNYDYGYSAQS